MFVACKTSCRSRRRRRRAASISAWALLSAGLVAGFNPAQAAAVSDLDIPAAPLPQQLAALAIHTDISIGGLDPAKCAGQTIALRGNFAPGVALQKLLMHTNCVATSAGQRTWRLAFRPAKPSPRPAFIPVPMTRESDSEITVVINRRPQPANGTASALSVVPSSVIESGAYDIAQLASHVPGMAVTNLGPGRDKILLRGLSDSVLTGRTQSLVGLYLDDTPLTYNAPDPDLLLVDMARVEVLKGPQGALYGQGSLSGVVRLVTNKPQLDAFAAGIDAGIGLSQRGQPSDRVSAVLNLPLLRDRLGARLVAYDDNSGGFIKDPMAGPKATNTTRRVGGRLEILGKLGDFALSGTIFGQDLKSNNSQYVTAGGGGPYVRTTPVAEPHDNTLEDATLALEGPTHVGTLKITFNRLHHYVLSGYDAQPLAKVVSVPNSGAVYYDEEQNINLDTQEISLISPSRQKLRWLAGLFRGVSEEHFTPHLVDLFSKRTLYNEDRIDRLVDTALFGEVAWDFAPKWTVTTGLRYALDRHNTESQINHVRLTNYLAFGDVNGVIDQDRLSYTSSLGFQATSQLLWYLQAGNGYRSGGFNTTTLAQTAIPSAYRGDALDSIETGWRYHTPHNRVRLTVAVFREHWRDIQSDQLRSTGLPITVNVGSGLNTGIEFEGDWKVIPTLDLHAVAQVNDPRLVHPEPLYANDQNDGMPYIAKRSVSLSGVWDIPWQGHTLENSAIASYRSQSPLNYGPLHDIRMDGYATLDLASALILTRLRYEARLDNATDVKSNSFAYGNPFTLGGSAQVTPLRPRTLWLSVDAAF